MTRNELLALVEKARKEVDEVRGQMSIADAALEPLRDLINECCDTCETRDYEDDETCDHITALGDLAGELDDGIEDSLLDIEHVLDKIEEIADDIPHFVDYRPAIQSVGEPNRSGK